LRRGWPQPSCISTGEAIRQALEAELRAMAIQGRPRRRMSVEQMRALGAGIAALPLLDPRSPAQIMDDLNAPYDRGG
jgi:antitoxin VapB